LYSKGLAAGFGPGIFRVRFTFMWHPRELSNFGVGMDPIHDNFFVQDSAQLAESLVRETLQNSLDAKDADLEVVRVRFSVKAVKPTYLKVFDALMSRILPHLRAAKPALHQEVTAYGAPRVLVIEDFGTTGLEGDETTKQDDENHFANFWRFVGRTEKGGGRGGSFGIGKVVIPMSSLACTFFGVTVRAGQRFSPDPLFMGQAMLPQHRLDGTNIEPFILFGVETRDIILPVSDPTLVATYSGCLDFKRTANQLGTSIAIPYPAKPITCQAILDAVVKHYFYTIIKGQLVVEIDGDGFESVTLTRANIRNYAATHGADFQALLGFVEETVDIPEGDLLQLPYRSEDLAIDADTFESEPAVLEELRKKYEAGELLSFVYSLPLDPVDGEAGCGDLHLYIRKAPEVTRGLDVYMRSGISVYANSVFKESNKSLALLVADEELICELLRLSEGPAHNTWIYSSNKAATAYRGAPKSIKAAKNALRELHALLAVGKEEQDTNAFAKFFPSTRKDEKPVIDGKEPRFNIVATGGVVTIARGRSEANPSLVGLSGKLSVNYVSPPGAKKYSKIDFDLTKRPPMSIRATGASFHDVTGNKFNFKIDTDEFELVVGPFDKLRDLEVRVNLDA
jgi:hypothetical protein